MPSPASPPPPPGSPPPGSPSPGSPSPDAPAATPLPLGRGLVALQFMLLAALALLAAPAVWAGAVPALGWALLAAGAALGGWAVTANRPGNFRILPVPAAGGRLVTSGPYRWVRHPMYSALLLIGLGLVWTAWTALATPLAPAAWLALLTALHGKARLEEAWMLRTHPLYAAYRAGTGRFVPHHWRGATPAEDPGPGPT